MTGVIIFLHVVVCTFLIIVILMQSGRGGGLTEGFAAAESIFGAQTNSFLVRATSIFAGLFLVTCLSLAFINAQQNQSLMSTRVASESPMKPKQGQMNPQAQPVAPSSSAPETGAQKKP